MTSLQRYAVALCAVALALGVVLHGAPAEARGTVRLKSTSIDENVDDKAWKLFFEIDFGAKPPSAYVPAIFSFKQTVLYQRELTDASPTTPVESRKPLSNQTPINLPMDLSFGDPASGQIWQKTKFSIKLTRDSNFEAGEYELKVKLTRGGELGGTLRVTLRGKNKVVDHRAMVFHDDRPRPKKKKVDDGPKDEESNGKRKAAEDMGPDLSDIPDNPSAAKPSSDGSGPAKVEPKQGGCGCKVVGRGASTQTGPPNGWLGVFFGLGLLLGRRRRAPLPRGGGGGVSGGVSVAGSGRKM